MDVVKSSRHQKIIGEFGEFLVCNWLSRSGFEVVRVDHTGIDVIAYDLRTGRRLGITVKSRTRVRGKEDDSVNIFMGPGDRKKLMDACKAFACEPWIAVYVETSDYGDLFLTSLENYDRYYRGKAKKVEIWSMSRKAKQKYLRDPNVKHIHIRFEALNWWNGRND